MTTRFPTPNLPSNMSEYQRALENSLNIADSAQSNSENIIRSLNQSVASNFGLGARLTNSAGSLATKVVTRRGNYQAGTTSNTTLQRSWTNLGGTLTLTTPNFVSNIALNVSGVSDYDITGGTAGALYFNWHRILVSGAFSASHPLPYRDFGQVMIQAAEVPANTNIVIRLQSWGYVRNSNGTFVNGTLLSGTIVRILASLKATALV